MTPRSQAAQLLPQARSDGAPYRIAVVCLGNICRSPIAEVVLTSKLADAGLADQVEVVSAGTGDWHVGGPMDRRAAAVLTGRGYDASRHRAQQLPTSWFDECDLLLAMDADNFTDIHTLLPPTADPGRIRMFRDFDPRTEGDDRDVPDPYYGGDDGFDRVLSTVERTADALVDELAACLAPAGGD